MTEDELLKIFVETGGRVEWPSRPAKGQKQVFRLGDTVRIKSGPFASFTGTVTGINQARSLLRVAVKIFGHTAPLKLRFADVEKVAGT